MDQDQFTRDSLTLSFQGIDWISINNNIQYKTQPVSIAIQLLLFFGAFMTFLHAYKNGRKWIWFWISCVLNGIIIESACHIIPNALNFYHSQAVVMIFNGQIAMHVIFSYVCFYYTAMVTVSHMNLSPWIKPFAVGLLALLMDAPFEMIGVKFVQWVWHDTDPNVKDRIYFVPCTNFIFHFIFSALISTLCHKMDDRDTFFCELKRTIFGSLLVTPIVIIIFGLIYHPFHDEAGVHTKVIVVMLLSIAITLVWTNERSRYISKLHNVVELKSCCIITCNLMVYYFTFLLITIFGIPENEVSVGYYQEIGPCNVNEDVYTPLGKKLQRNKYLCLDNHKTSYYDLHCTDKPANEFGRLYTVCGVEFQNRSEYILIISTVCFTAFLIFFNALYKKITHKKIK